MQGLHFGFMKSIYYKNVLWCYLLTEWLGMHLLMGSWERYVGLYLCGGKQAGVPAAPRGSPGDLPTLSLEYIMRSMVGLGLEAFGKFGTPFRGSWQGFSPTTTALSLEGLEAECKAPRRAQTPSFHSIRYITPSSQSHLPYNSASTPI